MAFHSSVDLHVSQSSLQVCLLSFNIRSVAEINVGIIVSCMPTFPALYKEVSSQLSAAWNHRQSSQVPKSSLKSTVGQSQGKKPSNRSAPEPVKPKVPPKDHIVELEASYPPEPTSHFSDDSSDLEPA